jgi:hypothetical protein
VRVSVKRNVNVKVRRGKASIWAREAGSDAVSRTARSNNGDMSFISAHGWLDRGGISRGIQHV